MHYLILGGGSAGCVLAARLSEDASSTVTLVEAGADVTAETMHPFVRSRYPGRAFLDPANIWPALTARFGPGGAPRPYQQARLLGGGSSINAMVANRGAPDDYDEWGRMGAEGWSFESALPYFRKLERDVDFSGDYHGADGPLPIRRIKPDRMSAFAKAMWAALEATGHSARADQNAAWEDGLYVGAVAVGDDGTRIPAAVAYLPPAVRARKNLTILTGHIAERVIFAGRQATGAVVSPLAGGASRTIAADTVIVSAGAIHTPALLVRSGIGPGATLAGLGIDAVAVREGVGQNLMEHPSTAVSTYLQRAMRLADLDEHHDHAILRFTSGPSAPAGDMHLAMIARSGWHAIGQRIGTLFIWVNKPYSRGSVTIASSDPRAEPAVDFRLLSDERDLERLKMGFRVGAAALIHPLMTARTGPAFPTSYSKRVAAIGASGMFNTLQRGLFSAMLDGAGGLRPALIHSLVTLGTRLDELLRDDAALTAFVTESVGGVWHASGTCRMGSRDDPMAVTDGAGRVYGADRLIVCDASSFPAIPRANTNIPTIMLAERIADLTKAAGRGG